MSAEAVANLEMRTEAAWRTWSPVATQWVAFVALTATTSAALWAGAGQAVARTYAGAVASGTTWSLAVTHLLPSGGHRVATSMGGTTAGVPSWVAASTRRSASSAGVEAPTVYLIDTEEPNAFAAGRGRDAVVAVTSGLLKMLSARETEAVLAHEIGHLARRDVGRSMQSAAMMSGFSTAARAGRMLLRKRRKKAEKDGEGSGAAVGLALLAAGAASTSASSEYRASSHEKTPTSSVVGTPTSVPLSVSAPA